MSVSDFIKKMMMARQIKFEEGRFDMLGIRGMILPSFTVTVLIEEVYDDVDDDIWDILFNAGKAHGEFAIEQVGSKHNVSRRRFFEELIDSANIMGIGYMEISRFDLDSGVLEVKLTDSPFVEEFADRETFDDVDRPVDQFHRGAFHGMGEQLFDAPVTSEEVSCRFLGDDACRIRVQTQ